MLYNVPKTSFGPEILLHRYQPLSEQNALKQARVSNPFPQKRRVNTSIVLKDGRRVGLSQWQMRKSTPYLSRGLGNIFSDAIGAVSNTIKSTVSTVSGTVTSVGTSVQPIEKLLAENPSLVNLVKSYIPTYQKPANPVVVPLSGAPVTAPAETMGVSNKVWTYGAIGLGAVAILKLISKR